jgi:hypothetical protein
MAPQAPSASLDLDDAPMMAPAESEATEYREFAFAGASMKQEEQAPSLMLDEMVAAPKEKQKMAARPVMQPARPMAVTSSAKNMSATTVSAPASMPVVQPAKPSGPINQAAYNGLVQAQKFDGSWAADAVISKVNLSIQVSDVKTAFNNGWEAFKTKISADFKVSLTEQKGAVDSEAAGMMGALLALVVLDRQFGAKRLEWTILAEKARSYLIKRIGKLVTASGSVDWMKNLDALIAEFGKGVAI